MKLLGEKRFETLNTNKSYSKEFKEQVIKDYITGEFTYEDLANKYNISTDMIVIGWVLKYNKGIEIKDYNPKGEVYIMKARKTTYEERIEIVKYVLTNDNDIKAQQISIQFHMQVYINGLKNIMKLVKMVFLTDVVDLLPTNLSKY